MIGTATSDCVWQQQVGQEVRRFTDIVDQHGLARHSSSRNQAVRMLQDAVPLLDHDLSNPTIASAQDQVVTIKPIDVRMVQAKTFLEQWDDGSQQCISCRVSCRSAQQSRLPCAAAR